MNTNNEITSFPVPTIVSQKNKTGDDIINENNNSNNNNCQDEAYLKNLRLKLDKSFRIEVELDMV